MLRRLLLPVALAAALAASATSNARTAKTTSLVGKVGPGYTIGVTLAGKTVKTLKAGAYTLAIEDKSSLHNFHLFGKRVDKSTTVPFVGAQRWKVTLKPGTYTYQCDVHATQGMKGTFKVTK
jgi:plastocyanin